MSSALFGSGPTRSKNLVEFKAGRMNLKGKMVHPDKRKGLVYVYQSEDALMHFCWKDRTSGVVEDDLMIFPDDVEIKRVAQCTTGRVYLMRFKSSNKKFFFWMQETETEKDEKYWKKVNDLLNNPPAAGSASSSVASAAERGGSSTGNALASVLGSDFGGLEGNDIQNLIGSMSDQQLQMFLGGFMPVNSPSSNRSGSSSLSSNQTSRVQSATPASRTEPVSSSSVQITTTSNNNQPNVAESKPVQVSEAESKKEGATTTAAAAATTKTTTTTTGGQKMQFSDFQNILGNLTQGGFGGAHGPEADLSDVLTMDIMAPILANKEIQERLMQHMPESEILPKTEKELRDTMTSPQFKKALSSFCMALRSGQLGPLFKQFNLPDEVSNAAAQGNLEAFAKAMEAYAKVKKEKKSEDDAMDTK